VFVDEVIEFLQTFGVALPEGLFLTVSNIFLFIDLYLKFDIACQLILKLIAELFYLLFI
jgi:hypothetical protein